MCDNSDVVSMTSTMNPCLTEDVDKRLNRARHRHQQIMRRFEQWLEVNGDRPAAGGLFSYGVSFPAIYKRAAEFVDVIVKAAKPADLPVEQPTKFELILNQKTADAIGIALSPAILLRADEVIE